MKKIFFDDLKSKEEVETAIRELGLQGVWGPDQAGEENTLMFETPDYAAGHLEGLYTISWFPDHCELNLKALMPSIEAKIRFTRISSPDDKELGKLRDYEKRLYGRRPKWKDKDMSAIDEWEWATFSDPDRGTKVNIRTK